MNPNAAIVIFTKYLTSWDFNSLGKRLKVRQFFSIWLRHQTYCLSVTTVQLHEIQYTKVQGVPSISAKIKRKWYGDLTSGISVLYKMKTCF